VSLDVLSEMIYRSGVVQGNHERRGRNHGRNGKYRAYDPETGASGAGNTRSVALAVLAARLGAEEGRDPAELGAELEELAEQTQRRFEEEGVTEEDIEAAITWARSE